MQVEIRAGGIPVDSLTRAVAEVFRQSEYRRGLRRSLLDEMLRWLSRIIRSFYSTIDAHPVLRYVLGAAALALIAIVLARVVYVRQMHELTGHRSASRTRKGALEDPWTVAQRSASEGNYLVAAHALYLAVLQSLAMSDRLTIDSAKTVGDYTRELRRSSSPSLPLYRDFARLYEPVVWGSRECDNRRFDQLLSIASRLAGRRT